MARSLVASGLLPAFGLMHASVSNAFNLADDFVEPFRPFVDVLAWRTVGDGKACRETLSVEDRRVMAAVALTETRIAGEAATLLVAAERAAESFLRAIENGSAAVVELPTLSA